MVCTYSTHPPLPVVDSSFELTFQYMAFTSGLAGEAEIGRNHSDLYGPRIIFSRTILFRKPETNSPIGFGILVVCAVFFHLLKFVGILGKLSCYNDVRRLVPFDPDIHLQAARFDRPSSSKDRAVDRFMIFIYINNY